MDIIHGYRKDEKLRKSFDDLAGKHFGISFETWYQKGYWNDLYVPYSVVDGNRVVANVSVS